MIARTRKEIKALREGGQKLASILIKVQEKVIPGIPTEELDILAERFIKASGGTPSFKGYKIANAGTPYPASLCTSVNDEIVHAIPGSYVLKDGDIISLDIGMKYQDLFTDMAITIGVGEMSEVKTRLIAVTKKALEIGINAIKPGGYTGDVGEAIQRYVEGNGFGVVRELVGHGVGKAVHEDPEIPNWGSQGTGIKLCEGMVLALEPMVTLGSPKIMLARDGWTWKTLDKSLAAHFEHTLLITNKGAEVLTDIYG